jgi:hypothetical protein
VTLTQEEFDEEAAKRHAEVRGAEGRVGEEDDDDEDDNDEDPFPCETRRRPIEEELYKDFYPNEEVGIKP